MNAFLLDNNQFTNYSIEHFLSLFSVIVSAFFLLVYSFRTLNHRQHHKLFQAFAALVCLSQVFKSCIRVYLGNFNILTDLPLELCNIMTFLMLFTLLTKNRALWAIIYFWIMSGTFQALFTPTLLQSFPNYEFFRYWLVHGGLVICAIYPLVNLNWTLQFSDIIKSMISLNILAFIMYHFNRYLGSNYMYLNAKPSGDTLYKILGEWPYYILQLELVMIILFSFWFVVARALARLKASTD